MDEMQELKKGFNQGYRLFKDDPELAFTMANGFKLPLNPYVQGFISGVVEMVKERGEVAKYMKLVKTLDQSTERGLEQ